MLEEDREKDGDMGEVDEGRKILGLRVLELEEIEGFGDALLVVTAEAVCGGVSSTITACFPSLFS